MIFFMGISEIKRKFVQDVGGLTVVQGDVTKRQRVRAAVSCAAPYIMLTPDT